MPLLRAIATVGGWTMASRVLGFVRDILIATVLGAGPVADAFFVAFKLPNLFRRLLAEGAFNAAFVPQFAGRLAQEGVAAALAFASRAFAVLLVCLFALILLAEAGMPFVVSGIAPGFRAEPATFAMAVEMARITFPYILFMALSALYSGMLNSLDYFAAPAAAPMILNLVFIAALLGFKDSLETPGHVLAWALTIAGVAQMSMLAISADRVGLRIAPVMPRLTPDVRHLLGKFAPVAAGAGITQINLLIDTILASTLATGSISYLYFADRVNQLPLGVVGIATGIALLPMLARQLRAGDIAGAHESQSRAIEFALLLTLPAAAALIAIPGPIIRVLFAHGAFGPADASATAGALAAFALGLPAYVLIKTLTPGFYAREDTTTPVKIAAVAVVVNIAAAITLMQVLAHVGIALATALAAWVNCALLGLSLKRRGHLRVDARLKARAARILAAAAAMAVLLWVAAGWAEGPLNGALWQRIVALAGLVGGGAAVFALLAVALRAASPAELRSALRRG